MTHYIDNANIEKNLTHTSWSPSLVTTTLTLNGTLTLTNASGFIQEFTGTATGFKIILPNATTLTNGWKFDLFNSSSTITIPVYYNDTTTLIGNLLPSSYTSITLESNATTNGLWLRWGAFTGGQATGILNYNISSSTPFTLSTGTNDTPITGMSITPTQGTYALWYDGSIVITGNNTVVRTTFYKANAIWTDSLRTIESSVSTFNTTHSTIAIIQFTGSELLEVRVARSSNTLTINGRSLIMIRLGD